MTMRYADPSAIVATYLSDHEDHELLRSTLREGTDPVLVSEIARVEVASAAMAAERARRVPEGRSIIDRFEVDCLPGGPFTVLALESAPVIARATELVEQHPVAALDALHLAVAVDQAQVLAEGEPLVFVTRDRRQADAARALGLRVE
jgi:predicted nucleic acid-binding protein